MLFMNEWEIKETMVRYRNHAVLSKATRFLDAFKDQVNLNSDGWPYWSQPVKSAAKLMQLIENPDTATEANFRKALMPIRSFYTRKGYAAGMQWPVVF
jgi:hypothetical protein